MELEILKLSALEIKEQIKKGNLTCEQVVKAFVNRINETQKYNAVLEVFSDAIANAKIMDEKIKNQQQ